MATQFQFPEDAIIKGFVIIRYTHIFKIRKNMCLFKSWNENAEGTCISELTCRYQIYPSPPPPHQKKKE